VSFKAFGKLISTKFLKTLQFYSPFVNVTKFEPQGQFYEPYIEPPWNVKPIHQKSIE